jgi:hypothetical protein
MQSTDRAEFEEQMKILCAAYDKPLGDRIEAYWKGLAKMSLVEFARVVEWCCGENQPEKFPPSGKCWDILKILKNARSTPAMLPRRKPLKDAADNLAFMANRCLFACLTTRCSLASGGTGFGAANMLQPLLKFKNELVVEFTAYVREGDELATFGEFVRRFHIGVMRITNQDFRGPLAKLTPYPNAVIPSEFVEAIDTNGTFDFTGFDRNS